MPVAKHDSRAALDLEVAKCFALSLSKVADLLLRKGDGFLEVTRNLICRSRDLFVTDPERLRRPVVELLRILADGGFAVLPDVREDSDHLLGEFRGAGLRDIGCLLQILHEYPFSSLSLLPRVI